VNDRQTQAGAWLFRVEVYPEESFGHLLGRFRWANYLSSSNLSVMLGLSYKVVEYWEIPSRRRQPNAEDVEKLAKLMGLSGGELRSVMKMPKVMHLRTRLCKACYVAAPYHRKTWQDADVSVCLEHRRELLSSCPGCGSDFLTPVYWEPGQCDRCYLPFSEM
jgi:TniQ